MKRVTSAKTSEIKRLASEGKSMREIGKSVHLHHSTVASYLKSVEAQKNRGGKPKALSKRLVTQVVRGIESSALVNARHAADHIFNTHSIKISKWTIARIIRSKGLKSYSVSNFCIDVTKFAFFAPYQLPENRSACSKSHAT